MILLEEVAMATAIVLGIAVLIGLGVWLFIAVYEGGSALTSMIDLTRSITKLRKQLEEMDSVDKSYTYRDTDMARVKEQIRDNKVNLKAHWDILKFVMVLPVHASIALFRWISSFFEMINILKEKE